MSSIHAEPPPPIVTEPTGINYATGSALGKGGFAICHRAERYEGSKPTGHMVALKIVKTKMEPAKLAQKFVSELQIHSKLTHPNIVTFYRAFSFHTSTYVVLELCPNGSLADMLKKRKFLTLPEIRRFVIQICGAVKYLHHRHIVHRDLKTGNLFLDEHMNVKVGDFGLAALLVTEKEMEVKRRTTMCGTPNYLAPEILEKGKGHNEKVDLWSIGVIAYTLAVGKAPFHASSKEEIYKKLKQGDYKWPELSATSNDISSDLRKTVASLLVEEQDRPSPDKIVSQPFFKIAFVPARIPTSAREKAPQWPEVSLPSTTVRRQGWSDSWHALCMESGVGEKNPGDRFPLNGGQRVKSIVHDMEREAQLGTAPVMPIPKETVYKSIVSNWEQASSPEPELTETVQLPSRSLKEISHNEVARSRPAASARRVERDAELMPPPARPAPRVARTATVRKAARTLSEETEKAQSSGAVRIASDTENMPAARAPRSRAITLTASTTLRDSNAVSSSTQQTSSQPSEPASSKPPRAPPTKRSADASLARRPRATTKRTDRPVSPDPGPLATLEELKQVSPIRRPRRKVPPVDVIEIHSDPDSDSQQPKCSLPSSSNPPSSSAPPSYESLALPPPPRMPRTLPKPKPLPSSTTSSNPASHPGTDPTTVLLRLRTLHSNLCAALSNTPPPSRSYPTDQTSDALNLPFVSKWVDYSVKHGIGYVLASGTIGCVFNATPPKPCPTASDPCATKAGNPVTHVYHPNGRGPLAKLKKDLSNTSHLPLEILEDAGEDGVVKKIYKGLGCVETGPLAAEAARRRALSVLWAKFGRYMCASLDSGDAPAAVAGAGAKRPGSPENFVRFYQRIGGVGFWAFAGGEVQVHFPDHTKFVFSADGTLLNSTLLTPEGAGYLAAEGSLLPHHISGREIVAGGLREVLWEGGRVRGRVVRVNEVRRKVEFVSRVVGEWVVCGGLGRLRGDVDVEAPVDVLGGEELVWEGLSVGGGGKKVERVTVGRFGGDGVRERV